MQNTPPDWQGLLAPITPICPAGSDLSTDLHNNDLFLRARDIRNTARDSERARAQGNACDNTRLRAQWQQIATLCCEIITSHSKDLDVCAWLIEAWARLHGLRGIADGFALYRELLTGYWHCLYPTADTATEAVARVSALNALNGGNRPGTLVEAMHYFIVAGFTNACESGDEDSAQFTFWQYRAAVDAQRPGDDERRQQRIAALGFSLQQIRSVADDMAITAYQTLIADCDAAQHALRELDDALMQTLGADSPGTALIHTTLDEMRDALTHLAGQRLGTGTSVITHRRDIAVQAQSIPIVAVDPASQSALHQRGDAIAQLGEVARYFRAMEPHSPLASAIDRLVRWANMPCDELMRELIPDRSARDALWLMTGIAPE